MKKNILLVALLIALAALTAGCSRAGGDSSLTSNIPWIGLLIGAVALVGIGFLVKLAEGGTRIILIIVVAAVATAVITFYYKGMINPSRWFSGSTTTASNQSVVEEVKGSPEREGSGITSPAPQGTDGSGNPANAGNNAGTGARDKGAGAPPAPTPTPIEHDRGVVGSDGQVVAVADRDGEGLMVKIWKPGHFGLLVRDTDGKPCTNCPVDLNADTTKPGPFPHYHKIPWVPQSAFKLKVMDDDKKLCSDIDIPARQ